MQQITCAEFFGTFVKVPESIKHLPFKGFSHQSQDILSGQIFLAFPGVRTHGVKYAKQAFELGAIAVITEDLPEDFFTHSPQFQKHIIVTTSLRKLLFILARTHRQRITYPIIGITGSVGKTTFKSFAAQFLGEKEYFFSKKNWNNALGVLINLCSAPLGLTAAFFECGISQPGEMTELEEILKPDKVVITCFAESHLSFLKTVENVAYEKLQLIKRATGLFIHEEDLEKIPSFFSMPERLLITIHQHKRDVKENKRRSLFLSDKKIKHYSIKKSYESFFDALKVQETFYKRDCSLKSFDNILVLFISLCHDCGFLRTTRELSFHLEVGRGLIKKIQKNVFIADHSYNCSPQTLRYILLRLSQQDQYQRKILFVGDILEQPETLLRNCFLDLAEQAVLMNIELYVCGKMQSLWSASKVQFVESLLCLLKKNSFDRKTLIALSASRSFAIEKMLPS